METYFSHKRYNKAREISAVTKINLKTSCKDVIDRILLYCALEDFTRQIVDSCNTVIECTNMLFKLFIDNNSRYDSAKQLLRDIDANTLQYIEDYTFNYYICYNDVQVTSRCDLCAIDSCLVFGGYILKEKDGTNTRLCNGCEKLCKRGRYPEIYNILYRVWHHVLGMHVENIYKLRKDFVMFSNFMKYKNENNVRPAVIMLNMENNRLIVTHACSNVDVKYLCVHCDYCEYDKIITCDKKIYTCNECKLVSYCSLDCKTKDGKVHSQLCKVYCNHCGMVNFVAKLLKKDDKYYCSNVCNSSTSKNSKMCGWCKGKNNLMLCGRCKNIYYCSKKCQILHYKQHKKYCNIK